MKEKELKMRLETTVLKGPSVPDVKKSSEAKITHVVEKVFNASKESGESNGTQKAETIV
jgi:hypothetical protein